MGKKENSDIHQLYSDWHWNLTKQDNKYKKLFCCDLDRLWVEVDLDGKEVVCILDLKWQGAGDSVTPTESMVYRWMKKKGARVYIVYISRSFESFTVVNDRGQHKDFNSEQFADWLLKSRKK